MAAMIATAQARPRNGARDALIISLLFDTAIRASELLQLSLEDINWEDAKEWAANKAGGDLPTGREQALLFANCKSQFQADWYWSGELNASDARSAWYQGFDGGSQGDGIVGYPCRARAVRRFVL